MDTSDYMKFKDWRVQVGSKEMSFFDLLECYPWTCPGEIKNLEKLEPGQSQSFLLEGRKGEARTQVTRVR